MWTLIKAVLRFFKNSKLSLIGLLILIFFSSTIFTVLNNTTINLNQSYTTISQKGNLHDFVINENYTKGNGTYFWKDSNGNQGNITVTWKSSDANGTTLQFKLDTNAVTSGNYAWTGSYLSVWNAYKDSNVFKQFIDYEHTFTTADDSSWANTTSSNFSSNRESAINGYISQKQVMLDDFVATKIREIYEQTLESQFKVDLRLFSSINISNNKQGIFFKVIESSSDYNIDKIVYYSGNELTKSSDFSSLLLNFDKTTKDDPRLLSKYLCYAEWSDSTYQQNFQDLYSYVEANPDFNPYSGTISSNTSAQTGATYLKQIVDNQSYNDKGYKLQFSLQKLGVVPINGTFDDFSAYEAVISPNYLTKTNKKIFNYQDWLNHIGDSQKEFLQWFQSIPDEYKVEIDNNQFIILGTGVSSDFMYPIVSFNSLVPNPDKEQVIYVNSSGYQRVYDGFRGSEQESFLVGKFYSGDSNHQATLNKINEISKQFMSWPANINAAYMADDTSNTISPTALRLQFIPQIVGAMQTVSLFLTTFVLLLSVFISIVIIQRFIQINRNSLGIMQANGYRKKEIIFALTLLIGIPVFISSLIGYIIGFVLQGSAISLLGGFWTIPTVLSPFSEAMLFGVSIVMLIIFTLITVAFSVFALRGETSEFMKDEAKYKMTRVAHILKKPFSKFGIIIRFRAAIAFSSIWRLILLSFMSALLMVSLTFSFNIINRFKDSSEATFSPRQYTYSLNLATPTLQGGQYYVVPYTSQGKTLDKYTYFDVSEYTTSENHQLTQNYMSNTTYYGGDNYKNNDIFVGFQNKYGNYQLVSSQDSTAKNEKPLYLKNLTSLKQLMDFSLGIGSISTNPWSLAASMMPPNYSNYANQAYQSLFTKSVQDTSKKIKLNSTSSDEKTYRDWIISFTKQVSYTDPSVADGSAFLDTIESFKKGYNSSINAANGYSDNDINSNNEKAVYLVFDKSKIIKNVVTSTLSSEFINLMMYLLSDLNYSSYVYGINYNKLVINPTDEPYTYMNFTIDSINGSSQKYVDSLVATGLDSKTKRVLLKNESGENINYKINSAVGTIRSKDWNNTIKDYELYPVIINAYAAEKYHLSIGDTIKISVSNSADRYSRQYFGAANPVSYLKVIDIATTYQGSEFYMNWYDTNKILGLQINNVSPTMPASKNDLSDTVNWKNSINVINTDSNGKSINEELPARNQFIWSQSGFNGIFSTDENNLVEVTSGVSLYSPSGLYLGTDKIDTNDSVTKSVFQKDKANNFSEISKITGLNLSGMEVDSAIQLVASIFGSSSTFSILSSANSKDSSLSVINTVSQTASSIQDVVLAIVILISIIIVIIISSIIINDSIKLAAILKCLGFSDKSNATSFLSVYFPVFLLGLIISVPFTSLMNFIYINVIFNFANILLVIPVVWWYYLLSCLGVILIFMISFSVAWWKISRMNLTKYIK